jgi:hypothetical protein
MKIHSFSLKPQQRSLAHFMFLTKRVHKNENPFIFAKTTTKITDTLYFQFTFKMNTAFN